MRQWGRAVGTAAWLAAAARSLAWLTPPDLPHDPAGLVRYLAAADPVASLTAVLAVAAWSTLGWLLLGGVAVLAGRAPGVVGRCARQMAEAIAPVAMRRAIELTLGLGIATAAAAPAAAAAHPPPTPSVSAQWRLDRPASPSAALSAARGVRPPPSLDRPAAAPPAERRPTGPRSAVTGSRSAVTVQPGDSLWAIAARQLGPGATAADVAASWPRWYAANRAVIGPDPDLILPGQRLVPPPPSTEELP
jgi:resuscitation-promoting factor RpfA